MRDAKKWVATEYFSAVSFTKDNLLEFLTAIKKTDENLEIEIEGVVFEGPDEISGHKSSLIFPMEVRIGRISIHFDGPRNRVYGPPEEDLRVSAVAKELGKFRNPLRSLSGFVGFITSLFVFFLIAVLILSFILVRTISDPNEGHANFVGLIALCLAFYGTNVAQKLSMNRFTRKGSDTFLRKYGDKVLPSVVSSLITAFVIWIFTNLEEVKAFFGLIP